ncbi:hypothetical protein GMMP13_900067 [Candidatus Magnetomoraceae bacterium gMMP-13]
MGLFNRNKTKPIFNDKSIIFPDVPGKKPKNLRVARTPGGGKPINPDPPEKKQQQLPNNEDSGDGPEGI